MNEAFEVIKETVDALKEQLGENQFEFRYSELVPNIEVIDLNCEEEHEDLDKIYMIACYTEDRSFGLHFESSLAYKSTFSREHYLFKVDLDYNDIYENAEVSIKIDVDQMIRLAKMADAIERHFMNSFEGA